MKPPHDPSPELAALLRLKRREQPPPGYFDEFAHAFRERQRAELLRVSAFRLLADRVGASFADWSFLLQPRWLVPAGAAGLALAAALLLPAGNTGHEPTASANPGPADSTALRPVAILPAPDPGTRTSLPRGAVPVSSHSPESPTVPGNGLRRTPGDALVPVASSALDSPSPQAEHGKVIILVR